MNDVLITKVPAWNKCLNLLLDPKVSEIAANGPGQFFMKRAGQRIKLEGFGAMSEKDYFDGIEHGLVPFAKSQNLFSRDSFIFEGRLEYTIGDIDVRGRCHIVLPPATDYPQVTIAKKTTSLLSLDKIAAAGSMSDEMRKFLELCVRGSATVVFSGSTGAGKDIHIDTPVPTIDGIKKAGDICIGDKIFDENGEITIVKNTYKPYDPRHYEITFNNGEKVKSGMGHLWKVSELNKNTKFGHKTKPLFTADQINSLKLATLVEDKYISSIELCKILGYKKLPSHIHQEIAGFGILGRYLYSFTPQELEKSFEVNNLKPSTKESLQKELELGNSKTLSLDFILKRIGRHKISRFVDLSSYNPNVFFYNRKEVSAHLLKANRKRIERRERIDSSNRSIDRPVKLITTEEMFLKNVKNEKGRLNYAVEGLSTPVRYKEQDLSIHPYLLGAWLGDGYSSDGTICGIDSEIFDKISENNEILSKRNISKEDAKNQKLYAYRIKDLRSKLKENNLIGNKHIPAEYLFASVEQRYDLLAGLIDTDGTIDKRRGIVYLEMTNEKIVRDARQIAASLALNPTVVKSRGRSYTNLKGDKVECKDVYSFSFIPVKQFLQVKRKSILIQERLNKSDQITQSIRNGRKYIKDIRLIDDKSEDYICFEVDSPNHMFLVSESFIPTHNTTMLEAVSKNIDPEYRIGVAEDTPELILSQPNVTYLHSTPWSPGMNSNDVATLDWVVAQFMRNRCDKLIIGETRGKEFAGFLTAANSGMEGGMTTMHAETPTACLRKMTSFTTEAKPGVPVRAINMDIATAVQIIVQLVILPGGKHRVSHIEEITPTLSNSEDAQISTQPLYLYDRSSDSFYKAGNMSDSLREYFGNRGQKVDDFLKSEIDKRVKAGSSSDSGGARSEMPRREIPQYDPNEQAQKGLRRLPTRNNPFNPDGKRSI